MTPALRHRDDAVLRSAAHNAVLLLVATGAATARTPKRPPPLHAPQTQHSAMSEP